MTKRKRHSSGPQGPANPQDIADEPIGAEPNHEAIASDPPETFERGAEPSFQLHLSEPGRLEAVRMHWPHDWWRCFRKGPVSGLYVGAMTTPSPGAWLLHLRVDIDPRSVHSPVLNKLSGDIFQMYNISKLRLWPSKRKIYKASWIMEKPAVSWQRCSVTITGSVTFYDDILPVVKAQITIPWQTFTAAGPARVIFFFEMNAKVEFECARQSDCFRIVNLEVDVADSVNIEPVLPFFNTHDHDERPDDLSQRTLTFEKSYQDAGIKVTVRPERTIIDDSDSAFDSWSNAELHNAMEDHFSRYPGGWPKWELWGISAGQHQSGYAGIMFDWWGLGEAPERQGFAVFRNISTLDDLVNRAPQNQDEAHAQRYWLYLWVHEAGHAFNLRHSFDKGRSDSASWMNYPFMYTGSGTFWEDFEYAFDIPELKFLRHGQRNAVIMGGDDWGTGPEMRDPDQLADAYLTTSDEMPIEVLVRSQPRFEFLEPVFLELRLRNRLRDIPLTVDTRLDPRFLLTTFFIRRPDGKMVRYDSPMRVVSAGETRTLAPARKAASGADRYSESVFVGFDRYGHLFDTPGEYRVKAIYRGLDGVPIPSPVHQFRVGWPLDADAARLAQDVYDYQAGMSFYLGGSASKYLQTGMNALRDVADRYKDTVTAATINTVLAASEGRDFFGIDNKKIKVEQKSDLNAALKRTATALATIRADKSPHLNIAYNALVQSRSEWLTQTGAADQARKEHSTLRKDLDARGVKSAVLEDIQNLENKLAKK